MIKQKFYESMANHILQEIKLTPVGWKETVIDIARELAREILGSDEYMVSVHDVANYILRQKNVTISTNAKLQKIVYYSQAWFLAWNEKPLFKEHIEAWANGPVVPALYMTDEVYGSYVRTKGSRNWPYGNHKNLNIKQKEVIDIILKFYGKFTGLELADFTCKEDPWQNARVGISLIERGSIKITDDAMMKYYKSLEGNRNEIFGFKR